MAKRLISVVVPTHNRPDFLRQALASIRAHEADDLAFQIIVGDNADDPASARAAAEFGAIYVPVAENGAGAARNACLKAATGEFVAFLDDDDVWLPSHVRPHLAILDARPEIEGVFAQVMAVDEELNELAGPWPSAPPPAGDALVRNILSGYYPQIGATIVRAAAAKAVGLFDVALLGDQDWDWQIRLARRRKVAFTATPGVLFRQRPPGSYDALQLSRLGFCRRVFLRHALAERRVWPTFNAMTQSYRDVMWQYYDYFVEAAVARASAGRREDIWRAVWGAWRTFPLRATYQLIAPKPLQRAFFASLAPMRRTALE